MIPYGRQWIDDDDIKAVVDVLRSNFITQGPKIDEFERVLAESCGAKYAVAVNSGTSALHIACLAAGTGKGDDVITSPITFIASANCAAYCGSRPVFADINTRTYNISVSKIEKKITDRTKIIIPVDFAGQSADMEPVYILAKEKGKEFNKKIFVIEDSSQAQGSYYKGKAVGSCAFSDMTVMSFHPVKHITTGEGGAVLTNDEELYWKLRKFRNHGITNIPGDFVNREEAFQHVEGELSEALNPWYYEQIDLGYNYRITDIQCALGISQMKKLNRFIKRRREIVSMYNEFFGRIENIQTPYESPDCDSNFHLYILLVEWARFGTTRAKFMAGLKKKGVHTQVHYIPVHTQPFYRKNFGTGWGDCPNAEEYYRKCLSIPIYPAMTDDDIKNVAEAIRGTLNAG
ncbi:MAG: UDP-4-amino-4,6-dideoxy-N-acetyl-beta-L-altrosamine transaminase [Nitrospiraceae bacterium]|nr:MAG: UDP-4-amino-4,6-dideoxy-N-acetyl-beta-L-altrosamine transaminase [Nitrospiraceae bacterium]